MTPRAQPMGDGRTIRKTLHKSNTLSRALEKAELAVQRDRAGNWRGALSSYRSARELLSKARRRTSSDEVAFEIDAVSRTYDTRIQQLREAINSEPREDGDESSGGDRASSTRDSLIDIPRRFRRTIVPASRFNDPQTPSSPYPPRRDSRLPRPLTPECEIKATIERYMKRKLPERPHSLTPRTSRQFGRIGVDDETIEILEQCESGWWTDLIEGNARWSLSSDRTLVPSPRKFLKESSKFGNSFSPQRNGAESPTDSISFWSPAATPLRRGSGGVHDRSCGPHLLDLLRC